MLDAFLGYCDPDRGFAWLACASCDAHRFVTFTCKGRGFCPTCCGRRMDERAARWCAGLLPYVPVRQWVLNVHLHILFLDGAFEGGPLGRPVF